MYIYVMVKVVDEEGIVKMEDCVGVILYVVERGIEVVLDCV